MTLPLQYGEMGVKVTRWNRVPDPYNPNATVPGDIPSVTILDQPVAWTDLLDELEPHLSREHMVDRARVGIPNPGFDIHIGDLIQRQSDEKPWTVIGFQRPVSPFTGWAPALVLRVERHQG